MKRTIKYTAIQIDSTEVDDEMKVKLKYGNIEGPNYNKEYPTEEFDTEDEAIGYAHKTNKYSKWLILPVISFDVQH